MLSVSQQCELLDLSRSSYYCELATASAENLALMALIDKEYTEHPFKGSRRMATWLRQEGHAVNRKRVQRLMRLMGLEAVYPKPQLSVGGVEHKVYPYLLRNVAIERVNPGCSPAEPTSVSPGASALPHGWRRSKSKSLPVGKTCTGVTKERSFFVQTMGSTLA